jgi:hypothetical protein
MSVRFHIVSAGLLALLGTLGAACEPLAPPAVAAPAAPPRQPPPIKRATEAMRRITLLVVPYPNHSDKSLDPRLVRALEAALTRSGMRVVEDPLQPYDLQVWAILDQNGSSVTYTVDWGWGRKGLRDSGGWSAAVTDPNLQAGPMHMWGVMSINSGMGSDAWTEDKGPCTLWDPADSSQKSSGMAYHFVSQSSDDDFVAASIANDIVTCDAFEAFATSLYDAKRGVATNGTRKFAVDTRPPVDQANQGNGAWGQSGATAGAVSTGSEGETGGGGGATGAGGAPLGNQTDLISAERQRQVDAILKKNQHTPEEGASAPNRPHGNKARGQGCLSDSECASGACNNCRTGMAMCFCN